MLRLKVRVNSYFTEPIIILSFSSKNKNTSRWASVKYFNDLINSIIIKIQFGRLKNLISCIKVIQNFVPKYTVGMYLFLIYTFLYIILLLYVVFLEFDRRLRKYLGEQILSKNVSILYYSDFYCL